MTNLEKYKPVNEIKYRSELDIKFEHTINYYDGPNEGTLFYNGIRYYYKHYDITVEEKYDWLYLIAVYEVPDNVLEMIDVSMYNFNNGMKSEHPNINLKSEIDIDNRKVILKFKSN